MPCLAFFACLTSCDDEMGAKADIDNAFASTEQPAVTMTAAQVNITTISMTGAVDNIDNVLEVGFQVSETEDFASCESYPAATVEQSFAVNVSELEEMTTYYVRPYAVTRAAGTAVGAVSAVTTSVLPTYALDGTYTVTEYKFDSKNEVWQKENGSYTMDIRFVQGSTTNVEITGLWGGDKTIDGIYDAATQTVIVPSEQVIDVDSKYGDVYAIGVNDAITAYTANIVFKFTPKGGKMLSGNFSAQVEAGNFGFYKVEMVHN